MFSRALALLFVLSLFSCAAYDSAAPPMYPESASVATAGVDASADSRRAPDGGESSGEITADRKLIRTGTLSVVVDEYGPIRAALAARITELGGFVADSDLSHSSGRVSYATLVIRVPADQFDALLSWTESKVEVQSMRIDTADVTERWVDTQARIDNNKRTERRLLGLLETDTAKLEDVLAVERELSRVRGAIESAEGQMRVLADQVGLATLTLQVSVRAHYDPAVAITYGSKISSAFTGSIAAMADVAKGLGIITVALLPWMLILLPLGWVTIRVGRMAWRRATA